MENKKAIILCLIGGILLIIVSATGSIGFFELLRLAEGHLLDEFWAIIEILLLVLGFIAAAGGFAVLFGTYLISKSKEGTGKFIIGIAVGMSLIGLIVQYVFLVLFTNFEALVKDLILASQSTGWIGTILTIIGRRMVKSD